MPARRVASDPSHDGMTWPKAVTQRITAIADAKDLRLVPVGTDCRPLAGGRGPRTRARRQVEPTSGSFRPGLTALAVRRRQGMEILAAWRTTVTNRSSVAG